MVQYGGFGLLASGCQLSPNPLATRVLSKRLAHKQLRDITCYGGGRGNRRPGDCYAVDTMTNLLCALSLKRLLVAVHVLLPTNDN